MYYKKFIKFLYCILENSASRKLLFADSTQNKASNSNGKH